MGITGPVYTTREAVKAALDVKHTARSDAQVDRAIASTTADIHGQLQRRFYPEQATRYFDWPNRQYARPWRLWLDQHEVIAVDSLTVAGVTIPPGDYLLEPVNDGPPFTHIEMNLDSSAAFAAGGTHQRAIALTGLFGYRNDEAPAGALAAAVASTTTTTIDVTDSATVGVGTLLRAGTERMIVTGKAMADTGQNIGADLTAQANNATVAVTDGTAYEVGEVLLVDAERVLIIDVAGNNLIVKRAWDGTALAAHTAGADIYAPRRLTVIRGVLGTAAAVHDDATALVWHVVPPLVEELGTAEAINRLEQKSSAYARTVGSGENEREASGRGLRDIRAEAYIAHGRKARKRAV